MFMRSWFALMNIQILQSFVDFYELLNWNMVFLTKVVGEPPLSSTKYFGKVKTS